MFTLFFELIQIALGNREMLNRIPSAEEWEEAYELARKQAIAGICFVGVAKIVANASKHENENEDESINLEHGTWNLEPESFDDDEEFDESWLEAVNLPEELYYTWMQHAMDGEKDHGEKWKSANELVALWKENGIDSIVLKGFSFAQFYPDSKVRHCGDLDVFTITKDRPSVQSSKFKVQGDSISGQQSAISYQPIANGKDDVWERSNQIVEDKGIKVSRGYYKNSSFRYGKLFVENHRFCSPLRGAKKGKEYEALLQSILMEGPLTKIGDSDMLCPPPLFNSLFCISHAYGHFMLEGGILLRHVLDWAMLMKAYKDLDIWNRMLEECKNFGYYRFAIAMSGLAKRIAGIEVPFKYQQDAKAEDLLLEDILKEDKIQVECHNIWQTRWQLIRCAFLSRWKYREFSDESMFASIVRKGIGLVVD